MQIKKRDSVTSLKVVIAASLFFVSDVLVCVFNYYFCGTLAANDGNICCHANTWVSAILLQGRGQESPEATRYLIRVAINVPFTEPIVLQ